MKNEQILGFCNHDFQQKQENEWEESKRKKQQEKIKNEILQRKKDILDDNKQFSKSKSKGTTINTSKKKIILNLKQQTSNPSEKGNFLSKNSNKNSQSSKQIENNYIIGEQLENNDADKAKDANQLNTERFTKEIQMKYFEFGDKEQENNEREILSQTVEISHKNNNNELHKNNQESAQNNKDNQIDNYEKEIHRKLQEMNTSNPKIKTFFKDYFESSINENILDTNENYEEMATNLKKNLSNQFNSITDSKKEVIQSNKEAIQDNKLTMKKEQNNKKSIEISVKINQSTCQNNSQHEFHNNDDFFEKSITLENHSRKNKVPQPKIKTKIIQQKDNTDNEIQIDSIFSSLPILTTLEQQGNENTGICIKSIQFSSNNNNCGNDHFDTPIIKSDPLEQKHIKSIQVSPKKCDYCNNNYLITPRITTQFLEEKDPDDNEMLINSLKVSISFDNENSQNITTNISKENISNIENENEAMIKSTEFFNLKQEKNGNQKSSLSKLIG